MVETGPGARTLAVVTTPKMNFRTGYRFIYRKNRAIAPATKALIQALRDEEERCARREQRFERLCVTGLRRSS